MEEIKKEVFSFASCFAHFADKTMKGWLCVFMVGGGVYDDADDKG